MKEAVKRRCDIISAGPRRANLQRRNWGCDWTAALPVGGAFESDLNLSMMFKIFILVKSPCPPGDEGQVPPYQKLFPALTNKRVGFTSLKSMKLDQNQEWTM